MVRSPPPLQPHLPGWQDEALQEGARLLRHGGQVEAHHQRGSAGQRGVPVGGGVSGCLAAQRRQQALRTRMAAGADGQGRLQTQQAGTGAARPAARHPDQHTHQS
jgi:hypothetical protein